MTDYNSPRQEIFDYVVTELLKQGGPAVAVKPSGGLSCAYRTPPAIGRRCAMGHLLPDSLYDSSIEGWSASRALESLGVVISGNHGVFLNDLQSRHDRNATIIEVAESDDVLKLQSQTWDRKSFYDAFHSFAQRWKLETTVLDKLIPEGGYTREAVLEMTS